MNTPVHEKLQSLVLERSPSLMDSPASARRGGRRSLRSEPFLIGVAGGTASGARGLGPAAAQLAGCSHGKHSKKTSADSASCACREDDGYASAWQEPGSVPRQSKQLLA
jgi:hypothetical protein